MPSALFSDASPSAPPYKPREIEMDKARRRERELAICPTDEEAIAPKKPHKQSFDYIWRTGVAGGVAASAVGPQSPLFQT
jgi:solute carrier family 25 protein 16